MKVGIFTDTYHPNVNGVVNTINRLEQYLNEHEVCYRLFYPGDKAYGSDNTQAFKATKLAVYQEIQWAITPYLVFKGVLDAYQPEVLHIITQGPIGHMAVRYAKERHIPYIAAYTTDFHAYLDFYKLEFMRPFLSKYLVRFHQNAYQNLVPSTYSIQQLDNLGICNLRQWARGIDLSDFCPKHRDEMLREQLLDGKEYLLMYCGRLAKEKQIEVLLTMMEQLKRTGILARLILVGDGPYRGELEALAGDDVTFMGYQSGQALAQLYASSDFFVFASEHETFGNVILEAFASGLPVVAIHEGGVKDTVVHLKTGIGLKKNTGLAFAGGVQMLIHNQDLTHQIREQALLEAKKRTWESLFRELVGLYYQAILAYREKGLSRWA